MSDSKFFLDKGKLTTAKSGTKPDYYLPSGSDLFSPTSNLIPGISGVSGGRVMLGAKSFVQALSLSQREAPLVKSIAQKKGTSFDSYYGKELASVVSPVAGVVSEVTDQHIVVTDNKQQKHTVELYDHFNIGRRSFLHNIPKVRVGERVNKGQLLAVSNFSDDKGNLALGTNLATAVMPYRSKNFEDAFVVSESGAKKLEAEQMINIQLEKRLGIETNKATYISLFANKFNNAQLANIDSNGVVKKGTKVRFGDPIILGYAPKSVKTTDMYIGKLSKALAKAYRDVTETWDYDSEGIVTDVATRGSLISVNIKTKRNLRVGDKLCTSGDHEVLTTEGWKFIPDVKEGDIVTSLNPNTHKVEDIKVVATYKFKHNKPMYCVENALVAMCVTDNHKVYADVKDSNGYSLVEAKNLPHTYEVLGLSLQKYTVLPKDIKWVGYDGYVYCIELEKNHIFYTRLNGKAHWTGNSNGFGNKGVIGAILPDHEAPKLPDGKPVDLILNSMSVTSRVSPALIVNMALGKVAQKTGKQIRMTPFVKGSSVAIAKDVLNKHKLSETEELLDPITGKKFKATVGPLYTSRLVHIAEDKISERSQGTAYDSNFQPAKAPGESAKRVGNLATTALLAHNAQNVLETIATVKATRNDEFWRNTKLGLPAPTPKVPFIFDKFIGSLEGAGIKVKREGHEFQVLPQTDKDVLSKSVGPIDNAKTFRVKGQDLIPEKGGLFDPTKVGILGDKFNHINLDFKVPNPISEDLLRRLLKLTKVQYEQAIAEGRIENLLKSVDVDKEEKELIKYIKSGRTSNRSDAIKVLTFLRTLKKEGLHPKDLLLSKVPVLPAQYRPIHLAGDLTLSANVNHLYKDLILNNEAVKSVKELNDPELQKKVNLDQYNSVKAVYGLGQPIAVKNRERNVRGLIAEVLGTQGGSAKSSMFQAKVVNKPLDLVGRAVANGDANLGLDEISIPHAIAWKSYSPHIIRRLVRRGIPATQAVGYVKDRHPMALQALQEEMKDRPVIMSRDPSLHKYNHTGFMPKLNADPKNTTISVNPLVFGSMTLDLDGDQVNINVPAGEKDKEEIKELMLPSKNILSVRSFTPMYKPSNEAALGMFQMSTEDKKNKPIVFKSEQEVVNAYNSGKLDVGDRVQIK